MDLDNWAKEPGLEHWSYLDCLPYYRKAEARDIGPNDYHGGDGPVSVTTPKPGNNPLFEAMVEAGVQAGYPRTDDLNGYQQEGFGPMDRDAAGPSRQHRPRLSRPARGRPNLTIRTPHALTDHYFCRQARGGRRVAGGREHDPVKSDGQQEVLLCAGAIARRRSCSAPAWSNPELLRQFDIPVVQRSPGMGENLQDHLEMYLQYECKSRYRSTRRYSGGTSRRSAPSGCSAAPASAPATSSKRAVLSAAAQNSPAEHSVPLPAGGD